MLLIDLLIIGWTIGVLQSKTLWIDSIEEILLLKDLLIGLDELLVFYNHKHLG